jgi:hypothetical protein
MGYGVEGVEFSNNAEYRQIPNVDAGDPGFPLCMEPLLTILSQYLADAV